MRHQRNSRRFGRSTPHRLAMFANMVTSLFLHERILTTLDRAKELRRVAERLITLGKRGDLHARRLAARRLRTSGQKADKVRVQKEEALRRLFEEIAPRYKQDGGYTRIIRTGNRLGDNAQMAFIELLPAEKKAPRKSAKKKPIKGVEKVAKATREATSPKKAGAAQGAKKAATPKRAGAAKGAKKAAKKPAKKAATPKKAGAAKGAEKTAKKSSD